VVAGLQPYSTPIGNNAALLCEHYIVLAFELITLSGEFKMNLFWG
jgi:hypothetical protein